MTLDIAALALLDCSTACNITNHDILVHKLSESFGVLGVVLQWFTSYLWVGRSACNMVAGSPIISQSSMVCIRDRFSNCCCSSSTRLTSARRLLLVGFFLTNTLMTYKYMAGDRQGSQVPYIIVLSSCVQAKGRLGRGEIRSIEVFCK
jgi:hypothetical protein